MNKKIAVIIPVYNEGDNLKILVPDLFKNSKAINVIVVDDNSKDDTTKILKQLKLQFSYITHLKRKRKLGRGTAVTFGFSYAYKKTNATIFVEMDADLSHDPSELKGLTDLVSINSISLASRYLPKSRLYGITKTRKVFSKIVNGIETALFHLPIHDYTNGYRAYPRSAIELLLNYKYKSTGFASIAESTYHLYKKGYKIKEQPTVFVNRRIGGSKVTFYEIYKSASDLIRIRFF